VTNGVEERITVSGKTKETRKQSSLLITRGWEIDCCSGEFKLKMLVQSMNGGESISMTSVLNSVPWEPCPKPASYCPACEEKCKKDREMREKNQ
jgi:hypothetical protein